MKIKFFVSLVCIMFFLAFSAIGNTNAEANLNEIDGKTACTVGASGDNLGHCEQRGGEGNGDHCLLGSHYSGPACNGTVPVN